MTEQGFIDFCSENDFVLARHIAVDNWLRKVVRDEGQDIGELTFIFCDDDRLHSMNRQYLKHDTLTDVLTFDRCARDTVSGDIFISTERTSENAKELNEDPEKELHRVMVHGLLHLLGYKDKAPAEKTLMTEKEDYYLSLLTF